MRKLIPGIFIASLLAACYPKGPVYVSELDLVATNYDDSFQFNEQSTFHLINKVAHIDDTNSKTDTTWDGLLLDKVAENMLLRGFESVNSVDDADVALTISVWASTSTNYYYDWYSYWGWGYPGYGPGWGWGYPGGGYTYVYSYTFGTVLIEMSYPQGADYENNTIPVVWTGIINGLVDDSNASINNRINESIDQAFEQSPYIISQ